MLHAAGVEGGALFLRRHDAECGTGVLEALFWHPGLKWKIDRIYVLAKTQFTNVRRNELKAKIPARTVKAFAEKERGELYQSTKEDIQQRAATILKEPHYIIEAHFEMTEKASASDNEGKFREMFCRRAQGTVLSCTVSGLP